MRWHSMVTMLSCVALLSGSATVSAQERDMTVRQGPETVFTVPVGQLFSELAGATATNVNGRVGPEFVFWGYRRADGSELWLYACALVEGVDCPQRRNAICDATTEVVAERTDMGRAVDRYCRSVAVAGVGELHPGCQDTTYEAALSVGVVTCR